MKNNILTNIEKEAWLNGLINGKTEAEIKVILATLKQIRESEKLAQNTVSTFLDRTKSRTWEQINKPSILLNDINPRYYPHLPGVKQSYTKLDLLQAELEENFTPIWLEASKIYKVTASNTLEHLNKLSYMLGQTANVPKISTYSSIQSWLAIEQEGFIRLNDENTRAVIGDIYKALDDAWNRSGDFTGVHGAIRDAVFGSDKTDYYQGYEDLLDKAKELGLTGDKLNKYMKEQGQKARGLDYKAQRIVQTEGARYNTIIEEAFYKANEDLVIGVEFIAESDSCETCKSYEGAYALDDNGNSLAPLIPVHPNCNCRTVPIMSGEESDYDTLKRTFKPGESDSNYTDKQRGKETSRSHTGTLQKRYGFYQAKRERVKNAE